MSKHIAYVKSYDGQTKWMYFLTEDNELLEKYNTVWDNVSTDIKENLIASLSITKIFRKPKKIYHYDEVTDFFNKKLQSWTLAILVPQ